MLKIIFFQNYPDIAVVNWMSSLLYRSLGFIWWKMVVSQLLIMCCNLERICWQLVIACMEALARYKGSPFLCVHTNFFHKLKRQLISECRDRMSKQLFVIWVFLFWWDTGWWASSFCSLDFHLFLWCCINLVLHLF